MRDEDRRLARLVPDAEELELHRLPGLCIERAERLVEEQDLGVGRESAREVDALLHAARELARERVLEALEADELDMPLRALARFGARDRSAQLDAVDDVAQHRAPGQQARLLEDEGPIRARSGDRPSVEDQRPAGQRKETVDRVQERGLAAARRTDDAHELAFADFEVRAVDGEEVILAPAASVVHRHAARLELHTHSVGHPRRFGPMV